MSSSPPQEEDLSQNCYILLCFGDPVLSWDARHRETYNSDEVEDVINKQDHSKLYRNEACWFHVTSIHDCIGLQGVSSRFHLVVGCRALEAEYFTGANVQLFGLASSLLLICAAGVPDRAHRGYTP